MGTPYGVKAITVHRTTAYGPPLIYEKIVHPYAYIVICGGTDPVREERECMRRLLRIREGGRDTEMCFPKALWSLSYRTHTDVTPARVTPTRRGVCIHYPEGLKGEHGPPIRAIRTTEAQCDPSSELPPQ